MQKNYVPAFKVVGWLEGLSFLALLLIGMPMKYMMGNPAAVKALGPVHGMLFIAYVILANFVGDQKSWIPKVRFYAYIASVIPFGTFWFEKKYLGGLAPSVE